MQSHKDKLDKLAGDIEERMVDMAENVGAVTAADEQHAGEDDAQPSDSVVFEEELADIEDMGAEEAGFNTVKLSDEKNTSKFEFDKVEWVDSEDKDEFAPMNELSDEIGGVVGAIVDECAALEDEEGAIGEEAVPEFFDQIDLVDDDDVASDEPQAIADDDSVAEQQPGNQAEEQSIPNDDGGIAAMEADEEQAEHCAETEGGVLASDEPEGSEEAVADDVEEMDSPDEQENPSDGEESAGIVVDEEAEAAEEADMPLDSEDGTAADCAGQGDAVNREGIPYVYEVDPDDSIEEAEDPDEFFVEEAFECDDLDYEVSEGDGDEMFEDKRELTDIISEKIDALSQKLNLESRTESVDEIGTKAAEVAMNTGTKVIAAVSKAGSAATEAAAGAGVKIKDGLAAHGIDTGKLAESTKSDIAAVAASARAGFSAFRNAFVEGMEKARNVDSHEDAGGSDCD